jgi:hypothetical protein
VGYTPPIPVEIEIARFALPTLATITAITTLALIFLEQAQKVRLRFVRNHVVICGPQLILQFYVRQQSIERLPSSLFVVTIA